MRSSTLLRGLMCILTAIGCRTIRGSAGFELDRGPSSRADLDAVISRVASSAQSAVPSVAVALAPPPAQGFSVFELPSGRRLGQVSARIDTRPIVVGDVVLSHIQGMVVAWSLDGSERWRLGDDGLSLNAAARDGGRIAITLGGNGLSTQQGTLLVLDAASGRRVLERRVAHALGQPAIVGDDLLLPWDGQNVSVFDVANDQEIVRVRSRDVMALCVHEGSGVYLGGRGLYRLSPDDAENGLSPPPTPTAPPNAPNAPNAPVGAPTATDAGAPSHTVVVSPSRWALPRADLPGNPPLSPDRYVTARAGLNARERVRVAWRPDPSRPEVALTDGAFYALFHRVIFGLDAGSGAVRWAYLHPRDIVAVEAVRGGVVFVDEQGDVGLIDQRSGGRRFSASLTIATPQVALELPIDFSVNPSGGAQSPVSPVEGLLAVAGDNDTRMMPAQLFAVQALAESPTAEATRALVAVVTHASNPQDLRAAASEALTRRTTGGSAITEALAVRYDYLRHAAVPPVGLLARALASAHEQSGVAALVAHLGDPATPAADVADIAAALRDLGDRAALGPLRDFLRLYHADFGGVTAPGETTESDERAEENSGVFMQALGAVAEAIARIGGGAELSSVDDAISDRRTPRDLRAIIAGARSGRAQQSSRPAQPAPGSANAAPAPSGMVVGAGGLTQALIDEAFTPSRPRLLECLRGASSRPVQVRIQFRYDIDGRISHPNVGRAEFQQCMGPIVTGIELPPSTAGTEIGTYYLQVVP